MHVLRREIRLKFNHPKLQKRPLIYYFEPDSELITNTAFNLAVYMMLDHNYSPEQAARAFTCIRPSPLVGFRDATWCDPPTYTLDLLSLLQGFRKGVDAGLAGHPRERLVDDWDCDAFEHLDNPAILNMNQVCVPMTA